MRDQIQVKDYLRIVNWLSGFISRFTSCSEAPIYSYCVTLLVAITIDLVQSQASCAVLGHEQVEVST